MGLVRVRLAVPDLRWEKLREINVVLDFGFLKDRINGSVDVFSRKTLDMLLDVQVPASMVTHHHHQESAPYPEQRCGSRHQQQELRW